MIIAFCGERQSGKDTAGAHLVKAYDFERRAFADPLKKAISALFDIPYWEVDKHKLDPTVYVAVGYKNEPELISAKEDPNYPGTWIASHQPNHMWSPISEHTFREMLQRFGTEMAREIFGYDFWLNLTLPVEGFYSGRKIVITDLRFQNELDRIHEIGGIVCRIKRPDSVNKDFHRSELIDDLRGIDYEIMNNTSINDFIEQVDIMIDQVLA